MVVGAELLTLLAFSHTAPSPLPFFFLLAVFLDQKLAEERREEAEEAAFGDEGGWEGWRPCDSARLFLCLFLFSLIPLSVLTLHRCNTIHFHAQVMPQVESAHQSHFRQSK